VQIVGQWDALVFHLHLFFCKAAHLWACGMVLKIPEKKVTLTFVGVSLCRLWVNGMLHLYTFLIFLKGRTFVGLWYGSKDT
jgi:hypothetical protein